MSKRSKLEKFSENQKLENVLENFSYENPCLLKNAFEKLDLKSQWKKSFFENDNPLVLELACGRGEYSLGMAELFPQKNYIGVDVKGARIWRGAKNAIARNLSQVAFVRTKIEVLPHFFGEAEVDEIWIIFPDPFLRKENRRLTSDHYLNSYLQFTHKETDFHLKTDDDTLYEFSLKNINAHPHFEIIDHDNDIYSKSLSHPALGIQTYYEKIHLSKQKKIKHIHFKIKSFTNQKD
jgi:tRNA (guanine-N7-)-methyltransferase